MVGRGFSRVAEFEVVRSFVGLARRKDFLGAGTLFRSLLPLLPVLELADVVTAGCRGRGVCFRAV